MLYILSWIIVDL